MSIRDFSWGKGGRRVWLTTYHPCSAETSRRSGALSYPEPLGPPRRETFTFTLLIFWNNACTTINVNVKLSLWFFFSGLCPSCNFITKQNVSQSGSASVFRYRKAPNLMTPLGRTILVHSAAKHSATLRVQTADKVLREVTSVRVESRQYVQRSPTCTQIAEGWKVLFNRVSALLPTHLWLSALDTHHSNRILSFYMNTNNIKTPYQQHVWIFRVISLVGAFKCGTRTHKSIGESLFIIG